MLAALFVIAIMAAGCRVSVGIDGSAALVNPTVTVVAELDPTVTVVAESDPTVTVVAESDPTVTVVAELDPTVTVVAELDPTVTVVAESDPTATVVAEPDPTATVGTRPEPTVVPEILPGVVWVLSFVSPDTQLSTTYQVIFDRDGTFSYDEPADNDHSNESWSIFHSSITLCINACFSEYKGFWQDDAFRGTASNATGASWDFVLVPTS